MRLSWSVRWMNQRLAAKARNYLGHSSDSQTLQIARTEGARVIDARGRRYIDFTSGWCVGHLGWNQPDIVERLRNFKGPSYVPPTQLYPPWVDLAERLAHLAPGKLEKSFRATGGTEAVDLALQAAMLHTGRTDFIAVKGSYHGNSLATISVAAIEDREDHPQLLRGCHLVDPFFNASVVAAIERRLQQRKTAAFILEPVSIGLGVRRPPLDAIQRIQRACRRHGTLIIADEVACGFGRTGKLFASEWLNLSPDILCLAKALSGGHAPIGATVMTAPVARSMEAKGSFYSTFGWHPLGVEAALANLKILTARRHRLLRDVAALSDYFSARLLAMPFKGVKQIRVLGLAAAVEFNVARTLETLDARCRENGLLVTGADDKTLLLTPPLTIDRATAAAGLDILETSARQR